MGRFEQIQAGFVSCAMYLALTLNILNPKTFNQKPAVGLGFMLRSDGLPGWGLLAVTFEAPAIKPEVM